MSARNPTTPSMRAAARPGAAAGATGWRAQWAQRTPRERAGLAVAALVLGGWLLWAVAVAPALRTLREVPPARHAMAAQQQRMLAEAAQAQGLRSRPPLAPEAARAALQGAAQRLGPRATLVLQGPDRATLQCRGLEGPALMAFISEARAGARARVVEARWSVADPGAWNGSVVLAMPSAEGPR